MNYDFASRHFINHFSLFLNGNKYQSQKVQCVILCTLHVIDLVTQSRAINLHVSPASYPVVFMAFFGQVSLWCKQVK